MTDAGELRRFLEQLQKATGWPTKNRAAAEAELEELAQLANGRTDS